MSDVTNYKCPSCTGPMHFSSVTQRLECDYCGSSYTVEEIDKLYNDKVEEGAVSGATQAQQAQSETEKEDTFTVEGNTDFNTSGEWSSTNMKAYNCTSCGAELICEEITVATSCPYCGNPTVIQSNFKSEGMPEYIIPFKLDKEAAKKALTEHYKNKKFLPKVFSKQNHIDEVKGVYIPFWLFDGVAQADVSFDAKTSSTSYSGDYKTTTTRHYDVHRAADIPFEKVPVDASIKMDNNQMDSLEPFDYNELKEFTPSYLPGYFAESYDDLPENCQDRLSYRLKNSAISLLKNTVTGYDSVSLASSNVSLDVKKVNYAFLPVWLLSTTFKGKNYLFAMNGQTGKMVGDLPLDKGRYAGRLISILLFGTALFGAAIFFVLKLLGN